MDGARATTAQALATESALSISASGGCRFACPICDSPRLLSFVPRPGYHILCGGCLGVLVVAPVKPKAKPGLAIRAITAVDLHHMAEDIQQALFAAKTQRLRVRIEAGESAYVRDHD